jgi:hypothetical protein
MIHAEVSGPPQMMARSEEEQVRPDMWKKAPITSHTYARVISFSQKNRSIGCTLMWNKDLRVHMTKTSMTGLGRSVVYCGPTAALSRRSIREQQTLIVEMILTTVATMSLEYNSEQSVLTRWGRAPEVD